MKKLLIILALMASAPVMADEPCWLKIEDTTFNANQLTHMSGYRNGVYFYFNKEYFTVNVPNLAAGQKLIAQVVEKHRACTARKAK
jgi:hypothetical protein